MKPTLSKQPCAKASFLDIIEEKPCVACKSSQLVHVHLELESPFPFSFAIRDLLTNVSRYTSLYIFHDVYRKPTFPRPRPSPFCSPWAGPYSRSNSPIPEPISLASLLVYVQEVGLTLRKFPQRTKNIRDDGYKLPSLISQDKNSTYEILRCFKGLSPLFLGYNPEGDKRKAFAVRMT